MTQETKETVLIDNEEVVISELSDKSRSYLEHLLDVEQQLNNLTFKTNQLRVTKSSFLTLFNRSREPEEELIKE